MLLHFVQVEDSGDIWIRKPLLLSVENTGQEHTETFQCELRESSITVPGTASFVS